MCTVARPKLVLLAFIAMGDFFNTAGHLGTNVLLPGTDSNNVEPGKFTLQFNHPGTFVYYCRFHAQLDAGHQPAAPGPKGGIQDANGNFGTPMIGLITVLPGGEKQRRSGLSAFRSRGAAGRAAPTFSPLGVDAFRIPQGVRLTVSERSPSTVVDSLDGRH
jgi:hypothetical protein